LTQQNSELDTAAGRIPSDGVIDGHCRMSMAGLCSSLVGRTGDVLGGSVGDYHAKKMTWLYEKALQMRTLL